MKSTFTSACAGACMMASAATAAPVTIDFDGFINEIAIITGKDLGGVAITRYGQRVFVEKDSYLNGVFRGFPAEGAPFIATFTEPVSNVSLDVGSIYGYRTRVALRAYDAEDNFLGLSLQDTPEAPRDERQTVTISFLADNISWILLESLNRDDKTAYFGDNLRFETADTAEVPLPAGAVLLLSGLGGIAALRRRG